MTREEAREYVERWRKAGPELEKFRRQELRAMRHAEKADLIDSLLQIGLQHSPHPANSSGLVELQKILSKAKP
jgi:hypothetical protein